MGDPENPAVEPTASEPTATSTAVVKKTVTSSSVQVDRLVRKQHAMLVLEFTNHVRLSLSPSFFRSHLMTLTDQGRCVPRDAS